LDKVDTEDQKTKGYESQVLDATKENQGLGKDLDAIGVFGLSLYASQDGGTWKLNLAQGSRIPRDMPSPGSGYTSLMAKHFACGSLPFAQTSRWVKSVYLKDDILQAIKDGKNIQDVREYGGPSLEFLRRLPAEKDVDAYYGVAEDFSDPERADWKGYILKPPPNNVVVGQWHRAVVGIAFGGLVPQAARNVSEAVKFTVAGTFGHCAEGLEALVNELHKIDGSGGLFGVHVFSRCRSQGLIDFVNYTQPFEHSNPRDTAAIFARYMTLLERITAVCETPSVPCRTDGKDYACFCCRKDGCPSGSLKTPCECLRCPKRRMDHVFEAACTLIQKVYYLTARKDSSSLDSEGKELLNQDLGQALEAIRKRLNATRSHNRSSPISLDECATVVRCILAAWASAVPVIDLKEHTVYPDVDDPSHRAPPPPIRLATLDDLPPVLAFG
jgi:hypothetical protein